MKKSLTILALAFGVTGVYAQDLTSKKGETILPEAEDWSIGVDASPFLEYMGNFFGKTANNNAPSFNFLNTNQTITGKYFVDAQTAYRASLRIGFQNQTFRNTVSDRSLPTSSVNTYPNPLGTKENSWRQSGTNIGLSAGIEKRRGKTRLQGYYGGELGINFSSTRDVFEYGNSLVVGGANPVSVDAEDSFGGAGNVTFGVPGVPGVNGDARITERRNGAVFSFGVRAFIGVEYFILPKISLGGEFGWGIGLATGGKTSTTYESIGNTGATPTDVIGTSTVENAGNGLFLIDTDNNNSIFGPTGSLRLNFHF